MLAYDNLSSISEWLSDALCVVATGGTYTARQLHTDDEEMIFSVCQPVMITSVGEVIARSDLASRTITITLAPIPDDTRARELELAWWENKGQECLGNREFNAGLWMKSMSARFKGDYGEKIQTELTGKDGKDLIPEKRDDLELARFFAGILTNAAKQQESPE